MGCPNTRLCTLFASFRWKTHKPPFWNQGFLPRLAEKQVSMIKLHLYPKSVSETSSNQGFAQFGPKNCENDNFCQKTRLRCTATSCDVFCGACDVFCDTLRRFLRRPATSCDALRRFLAVFGRYCHFWPCPSHILENKGKRPKISGLMFGFPQVCWESGHGSLWQRLCCCTVCPFKTLTHSQDRCSGHFDSNWGSKRKTVNLSIWPSWIHPQNVLRLLNNYHQNI